MQKRSLITAVLLTFALISAPISLAEDTPDADVAKIDVNGAREYVGSSDDAVIMDVRTPAEYEMSHIPDAINLNVQDDAFEKMVADLDRNNTYIVHCTKNPVDGRSARALVTLQELGFRNLYSLEGGYIAWKEAELPLVEDDN
jgi:rhodanese-related sulfurtransferase